MFTADVDGAVLVVGAFVAAVLGAVVAGGLVAVLVVFGSFIFIVSKLPPPLFCVVLIALDEGALAGLLAVVF